MCKYYWYHLLRVHSSFELITNHNSSYINVLVTLESSHHEIVILVPPTFRHLFSGCLSVHLSFWPAITQGTNWSSNLGFLFSYLALHAKYIAVVVFAKHSLFLLSENCSGPFPRNRTIPLPIGGGHFIFQKQYGFGISSHQSTAS